MVKVVIDEKKERTTISITGHANYSSAGFDIVCSAISTTIYFFETIYKNFGFGCDFDIKEGNSKIVLQKDNSFVSKNIYNSFLEMLQSIEVAYPNYIEVVCDGNKKYN